MPMTVMTREDAVRELDDISDVLERTATRMLAFGVVLSDFSVKVKMASEAVDHFRLALIEYQDRIDGGTRGHTQEGS